MEANTNDVTPRSPPACHAVTTAAAKLVIVWQDGNDESPGRAKRSRREKSTLQGRVLRKIGFMAKLPRKALADTHIVRFMLTWRSPVLNANMTA